MKRLSLLILSLASSAAYANTVVLNPGATLTTGPAPNHHSIFAAHHNPANASFAVREREQWRMSYGPTIGMGAELGDVSNFVEEVDDLIDILEDPSESDESVQDTLDHFNEVLEEIGDEGYLKASNGLVVPLFPLYWQPSFFSGTAFVEMDVNTQIKASIIDAPVSFNSQNQSYQTATSAYLKSGIQTRVGLGYSRELFNRNTFAEYGGRLYGGVKLNIIGMELSKQIILLEQLDGEHLEDVIEEQYDNHMERTVNAGVDAGLLWVADGYQLGLSIENINAPEFEYGAVGVDCERHPEGSTVRNNCETAYYFGTQTGELNQNEVHTMHPSATVSGAYFFSDRFFVSGSMDLAEYDDIVGTENQWAHVSTAYYPETWWIPATRAGFHKNLAGSSLSSISLGFTFFSVLTLDLEMGLEKVTVDGSSAPRTLGFSIGLQEKF